MALLCLLTNTPWPWPTPAGAASARGGVPHPWNGAISGVEGAERSGGLHKRSEEDWGASCARQGRSPSGRLGYVALRGAQKDALAVVSWGGRCGREKLAEEGAGRRWLHRRLQTGRSLPPFLIGRGLMSVGVCCGMRRNAKSDVRFGTPRLAKAEESAENLL